MATSSSAAPKPHHHLHTHGGATAAPPPTPSTQPNLCSSDAAETLSRLFHRLPPTLSLSTRLSPRAAATTTTATTTTPLPTTTSLSPLPSSSFELGYFQLARHVITPQLAESAESEARSLSDLPNDQKLRFFPNDWPLGFDHEDDDDDETGPFCLDGACSTTAEAESGELMLSSLRVLTLELEKLGLDVVESLACAARFENPFRKKEVGVGPSSLIWVSDGDKEGRVYPYVVGLQYQIRSQKWSLLSDSGSLIVEPDVGSVLVMIGDIAQVWSNGKLKKVRGRPTAISEDNKSNSRCISMTLLLTLPLETIVSPLPMIPSKTETEIRAFKLAKDHEIGTNYDEHQNFEGSTSDDGEDQRVFNSFLFEDYAWRVYHERLHLKDPLDRYHVTN